MTKTITILAIAVAFVASSIITGTIVTAESETITACVNNKSQGKDLRIVDSPDDCRNNESVLQWNEQGPQGDPGPPGANGEDGTNGTNGEDGADGTNGTNGEDGADGTNGEDGADGTNGTNGEDGAPGLSGYEIVSTSSTVTISTGTTTFLSVTCPSGKEVLGGGYQIGSLSTGEASTLFITENHPLGDSIWIVGIVKTVGTIPATFTYLVFAQCANT